MNIANLNCWEKPGCAHEQKRLGPLRRRAATYQPWSRIAGIYDRPSPCASAAWLTAATVNFPQRIMAKFIQIERTHAHHATLSIKYRRLSR
jgi:hypothetical protein